MDWIAIIEAVVAAVERLAPIIAECFESGPEGVSKLRRARVRVWWRLSQELRRDGLSAADARAGARYTVEEIAAATDNELEEFLCQCHQGDRG